MRTATTKSIGDARTAFDAPAGPTTGSALARRLDRSDAVERGATTANWGPS